MYKLTRNILNCCNNLKLASNITKQISIVRSLKSDSAAYDGDGKTTVTILNKVTDGINLINTYSSAGFRMNSHVFVHGSILVFPTHMYSWAVQRAEDITPDSLLVLDLILPKVKMVVIGYGDLGQKYDATLPTKLRQKGISCELLPTPNAVTTYNYLAADSVHVAGAFIPVQSQVQMNEHDMAQINMDYPHDKKDYLDHDLERAQSDVDQELVKKTLLRDRSSEKHGKFD